MLSSPQVPSGHCLPNPQLASARLPAPAWIFWAGQVLIIFDDFAVCGDEIEKKEDNYIILMMVMIISQVRTCLSWWLAWMLMTSKSTMMSACTMTTTTTTTTNRSKMMSGWMFSAAPSHTSRGATWLPPTSVNTFLFTTHPMTIEMLMMKNTVHLPFLVHHHIHHVGKKSAEDAQNCFRDKNWHTRCARWCIDYNLDKILTTNLDNRS